MACRRPWVRWVSHAVAMEADPPVSEPRTAAEALRSAGSMVYLLAESEAPAVRAVCRSAWELRALVPGVDDVPRREPPSRDGPRSRLQKHLRTLTDRSSRLPVRRLE